MALVSSTSSRTIMDNSFPLIIFLFYFLERKKIACCYIYFVLCLLHLMADVSSVGHTYWCSTACYIHFLKFVCCILYFDDAWSCSVHFVFMLSWYPIYGCWDVNILSVWFPIPIKGGLSKLLSSNNKRKNPCCTELHYHSRKGEEKVDILWFVANIIIT